MNYTTRILIIILISYTGYLICSHINRNKEIILATIPRHASNSAKATNSTARLEWINKKRVGGYDSKKITNARKTIDKSYNQNSIDSRDGGISAWESLGPNNIGGRIRAIVIDPDDGDHIFVGAAAGGIWESTNGGNSWTLSNPVYESFPVMDLQYHPNVDNIIFAVTGEYMGGGPSYPGIGVLRSTDNGQSWQPMGQPVDHDFTYLSKIRFTSDDVDRIFVSGTSSNSGIERGTIYISEDFGTTWDLHWEETNSISGNLFDFEINPNNPDIMWAGSGHNVYYTSDAFDNTSTYFVNGSNDFIPQRCEVQLCKNDPDNVFVLRYLGKNGNTIVNNKYKTELYQKIPGDDIFYRKTVTEEFNNNAEDNILGKQGNYDNTLWVNPIDCSSVLMGGIDLWKYDTLSDVHTRISDWVDDIGGNNAGGGNNSVHADQHVIVNHPDFNGNSNQTVFFGNDGGIYKTDALNSVSQNSNWSNLSNGLNITQLYGADISYDGKSVIGGAQDNSYFSSTNLDANLNWNTFSTGDGGFSFLDKDNNNIMYSTTQFGKIYRSEDGGNTFCHILNMDFDGQFTCCNSCQDFSYINENTLFIAPFKGDPNNSSRLFIGGNRLHRSIDKGEHWSPITDDPLGSSNMKISAIDIAKSDSDIIWLGYDNGKLRKTTVGGGGVNCCWIDLSNSILPNQYITDIAIHPSNSDKVAVTYGGYNQSNVYVTFDGGDNWVNRSLDFDMQVNTVTWLASHSNYLYIGTDVGIFASNNLGINWNVSPLLDENEGPIYTGVEELFWQGDGTLTYPLHLCAATHGRGLWRTPAPIEGQNLYVNRLCNPCGFGTISIPFKTFEEAYEVASSTQTIFFQEGGQYIEIPTLGIMDKQINIKNTSNSSVIIE